MHLIIGGAYQGKLEYAMQRFGIGQDEVFECADAAAVEPSGRCIHGYERYIRACLAENVKPKTGFPEDTVIICRDIFCGVVPVENEERAWRELSGRTLTALAAKARTVTRIFCGLPQELKRDRK